MRTITLPDGSQWTMETLVEENRGRDRASRRRARVSRTRSYVWVRCTRDGVERRLLYAAAWELWPERQLAAALAEALARRAEYRPALDTAVDSLSSR